MLTVLVLGRLACANAFYFPVQVNERACAGGVGHTRDLALDFGQGSSKTY